MPTQQITFTRFSIDSTKSFDEVLHTLDQGISRPKLGELMQQLNAAPNFADYSQLINAVVGPAELMEFLRLDLGAAIAKDPAARAYKIIRIIAGNPLIMRQMVEHVPHAGSYAPITILVYEGGNKVNLCYDTMESLLATYGNETAQNEAALKVARDLDAKVIKLLTTAATL
jgi:uncharacterized protein (DUF302 family)